MHFPLCLGSPLEPRFARGTEVDICPRCRGIWLDRGELDRLLDGSHERDEKNEKSQQEPTKSKKPKKPKSRAKRLADLFEEVLDL